jgi:uncharacterized membrane-anchored protein YhcB (DUF1043 family)
MSPIILVGAGIVVFGIGLGLGYWFAHSQRMRESSRADNIQNELDDYRRDVSKHFSGTAEHFQVLGQQYQALYKHMSHGAESLCDSAQSDALLGFAAGTVPTVTAEPIDEPVTEPQLVTDYVLEEELRPSQPEPSIETTDTPEKEEETIAAVETADTAEMKEATITAAETSDESSKEEIIADQVAAQALPDTERTVH